MGGTDITAPIMMTMDDVNNWFMCTSPSWDMRTRRAHMRHHDDDRKGVYAVPVNGSRHCGVL
jgi:hypothetical protein